MEQFEIPIVLFIFKRKKAIEVLRRIKQVKPIKLYILADYGRNTEEAKAADNCRKMIEAEIDWNCEIVKNYATENRGVYANIGLGAKWVLEREKWAIFLEDDNLPEITFFRYCKEMLEKYENDTRILWICGTNWLGKYAAPNGESYVFTKHMMPCGWASWSNKFCKFYDGELALCDYNTVVNYISQNYCNKALYKQAQRNWMGEYWRIRDGKRPNSWDYQMDFSIKANSLFGVCPCNNQIKNIGVDEDSFHGGVSFDNEMTRRLCSMESFPLDFPLKHPASLLVDENFEKEIGKIILYPLKTRVIEGIVREIRRILHIPRGIGLKEWLKGKR